MLPGNGVTPGQGEPPAPVLSFPQRKQRRPGPANPNYAIPRDRWVDVLHRVEQGESYRRIAQDYHTSYESVRRVILALRKEQSGGEA